MGHCGTRERRNLISEEVYRKYFSYRPRQKTKDRVVKAQGAPCSHLGRVELQIRIREFQKPWEFHILDNMQYQCILGIVFMKASRLTLDFDQKSLIIPDNQIKQLPKIEKPVDIDLTDTKLGDGQQRQLKALFNNFKGLFSDQPGLTHVLYHERDTGDKGPVVSKPYRYDRVKSRIVALASKCIIIAFSALLMYKGGAIKIVIEKGGASIESLRNTVLRDGTICPINSPYASPVVLTRKKNDLPPDSPEAYRFAIDYRKLNGITKYPRYPLPVRVYRPRQTDTISSDSQVETLYDEQGVSHRSNNIYIDRERERDRIKGSLKNTGKPLVRKVRGVDHGREEITARSEHKDRKRLAPEQRQGVKRSIPPSISSRTYKFKRPNTSSQGVESIAGPSRLPDCRLNKSTTVESRSEGNGRDNKTRQTRATTRGRNKQAERPVRSNQATTRRPCPYYLRIRVKESDGIPEEQRNIEINGIPHSRIRRRSLSVWKRWMEIRYIGEFNRQKPCCIVSLSSRYEQVKNFCN
ncbi:retrovirus-related Pol polyprotein from transposon 297 [Trichonephila clavipes]|nr:retrovirus-related Pol polyprotein from transposon 297 [Trichonephila clavipes]